MRQVATHYQPAKGCCFVFPRVPDQILAELGDSEGDVAIRRGGCRIVSILDGRDRDLVVVAPNSVSALANGGSNCCTDILRSILRTLGVTNMISASDWMFSPERSLSRRFFNEAHVALTLLEDNDPAFEMEVRKKE